MAGGQNSIFGSGLDKDQADYSPSDTFGGGADAGGADVPSPGAALPANAAPTEGKGLFGSGLSFGTHYNPPAQGTDPLDASADLLQQRIQRANQIATNPVASFLNPEGVQAARAAVPAMTEQLQKIRQQKAQQAEIQKLGKNYGIDNIPVGADRETAVNTITDELQSRYLNGDPLAMQGLQQLGRNDLVQAGGEQALSAAAETNKRYTDAVGRLNNAANPGEYDRAYKGLEQETADGTHQAHELASVPRTFDEFQKRKQQINNALTVQRLQIDGARARMQQIGGVVPIQKTTDKDGNATGLHAAISSQVRDNNGNPMSGVEPVTVGGIYNGNRLPTGSNDIGAAGTKWGLMSNSEIKDVNTRIEPHKTTVERAAGINKLADISSQKDFGTNAWLLGHGIDQFVEISRNGVGGKGSATPGTIHIMESLRGALQTYSDKAQKEWGRVVEWIDNGRKGPQPYLSQETIKGLKDAITTLKQGSDKEIGGVAGGIAQYVGRHGGKLDDIGFEPGVSDALKPYWQQGNQEFKQDIASRPSVVMGGQRIVFDRDGVKPPQAVTPGGFDKQAQNPPQPTPQGGSGTPPATPQAPGGGSPGQPTGPGGGPITIAGQSVNMPPIAGVSPNYIPAMQRIESGNEKSPWTAGAGGLSSAGGAFQFIKSTWAENKPAGAPDDPRKATPQQQSEALATFTAKNVKALQGYGVPVTDTNVYIAHNVGAGGAAALLKADPKADARTIVGETAARNNPLFFKGRPTVATVLARYAAEMNGSLDDAGPKPRPGAGGATAEAPSLMQRVSRLFSQGVQGTGEDKDKAVADVGNAAVENAPAIGGTVGGVIGGPVGGAIGGGGGQSLKDYLQGRPQDPTKIAEEGALSGVLGVFSKARPVLAAGARMLGAGAVEGGAEAVRGGDAGDIAEAAGKGTLGAVGGEAFGRALGMAGHKVFSLFNGDAQKAVQAAAEKYHNATETLKTEPNRLPGAGGTAGTPNPKYQAAEQAKGEAETVLKDAGLNPEEAAYAHSVTKTPPGTEPVPKQEALVNRPGALEQQQIGAGYDKLRTEVQDRGVGVPKANQLLPDGPMSAVANKQVSSKLADVAERAEVAIKAPAPNWQTKWQQLVDARSALLQAERDALTSTATGRTQTAKDMRTLADTVRAQQVKVAKYVFGEKDGAAFIDRLKVLDARNRRLMEATNQGDLASAARLTGEAGRKADQAFKAFAHDDPEALAAWDGMRKAYRASGNIERDVKTLVGVEKIPYVGGVVSAAKMLGSLSQWRAARAAGSPVRFKDMIAKSEGNPAIGNQLSAAGARAATM